jgi:hypothetical protein
LLQLWSQDDFEFITDSSLFLEDNMAFDGLHIRPNLAHAGPAAGEPVCSNYFIWLFGKEGLAYIKARIITGFDGYDALLQYIGFLSGLVFHRRWCQVPVGAGTAAPTSSYVPVPAGSILDEFVNESFLLTDADCFQ